MEWNALCIEDGEQFYMEIDCPINATMEQATQQARIDAQMFNAEVIKVFRGKKECQ